MSKPLRFIAVKADQDAQDTNSEVENLILVMLKKLKPSLKSLKMKMKFKEDKKELVPSP